MLFYHFLAFIFADERSDCFSSLVNLLLVLGDIFLFHWCSPILLAGLGVSIFKLQLKHKCALYEFYFFSVREFLLSKNYMVSHEHQGDASLCMRWFHCCLCLSSMDFTHSYICFLALDSPNSWWLPFWVAPEVSITCTSACFHPWQVGSHLQQLWAFELS